MMWTTSPFSLSWLSPLCSTNLNVDCRGRTGCQPVIEKMEQGRDGSSAQKILCRSKSTLFGEWELAGSGERSLCFQGWESTEVGADFPLTLRCWCHRVCWFQTFRGWAESAFHSWNPLDLSGEKAMCGKLSGCFSETSVDVFIEKSTQNREGNWKPRVCLSSLGSRLCPGVGGKTWKMKSWPPFSCFLPLEDQVGPQWSIRAHPSTAELDGLREWLQPSLLFWASVGFSWVLMTWCLSGLELSKSSRGT